MLSSEPVGIRWDETSVTWYVQLLLANGSPATGLTHSSITAGYIPDGAARTAITPVTQTVAGAYTSGGFVEVDAANCPGLYRFDLPNALGQLRTDYVTLVLTGSGLQPYAERIPLIPSVQWFGTAATGTLTTQQFSTAGLPALTAGQLNRRQLQFLEGPAAGELVLVVGQTAGNVLSVAPPLTAAPVNGNRFVLR